MRYFAQHQIAFPRRVWGPGEIGTLRWGAVNLSRILAILHNPTYTGTYVYGRRRSQPVIQAGQITKVKTQQLPQEDWTVIKHLRPSRLHKLGGLLGKRTATDT